MKLDRFILIISNPDLAETKEELQMTKKYSAMYWHLRTMLGYTRNMPRIKTMLRVWDDFKYHRKIYAEVEDFTHTDWYVMRLKEYARDAMAARYFIDNYPYLIYTMFNPQSYWSWFGSQWHIKLWKYIGVLCWTWAFYYIMYCPGEYFYDYWPLLGPIWWGFYFWYLWYWWKHQVNEINKGKDLYLYKYKASKRKPPVPHWGDWSNYTYKEKKMNTTWI